MFFLQIAQAPVVFRLGDMYEVEVPKYTLRDMVAWGASISARWTEHAVKGMTAEQRQQHLAMYPPIPPTLTDLKRMLLTTEGTEEVLRTAFQRAKVYQFIGSRRADVPLPAETRQTAMDALLNANGIGALTTLAWEIADFRDASISPQKAAPGVTDAAEGGDVVDPLTNTGKLV